PDLFGTDPASVSRRARGGKRRRAGARRPRTPRKVVEVLPAPAHAQARAVTGVVGSALPVALNEALEAVPALGGEADGQFAIVLLGRVLEGDRGGAGGDGHLVLAVHLVDPVQ